MFFKQWGESKNEHDLCIIDIASELFIKGFDVYLEYEISLNSKRKKLIVDIYAKRGKEKYLIEVGTLAERTEFIPLNRLRYLKTLMQDAKVIHMTQWKNWINQFEWQDTFNDWYYEKYVKPKESEWINEMGESLKK